MALSGCASGPAAQPSAYVYPQKGQTAEKQSRDTADCQTWAKQQTSFDPLTDSAKGAGVGALVGAVGAAAAGIGAATGHAGTGAAIGAAAGGISGAGVGGT
jgi:outer membrane lipoprotein SlyB